MFFGYDGLKFVDFFVEEMERELHKKKHRNWQERANDRPIWCHFS